MNILLTGVGCPGIVGTLKALRHNPSKERVFIFGIDMDHNAVGRLMCDTFQRVSCPERADYIHILQRICEVNKIDIVIPQTTRESIILSEYKSTFTHQGIKVLVNEPDVMNLYNDKHALLNMCEQLNLPCASYRTVQTQNDLIGSIRKMGYPYNPIVIKPLVGNGGRGVRIIDKQPDFNTYLNQKPDGMRTTLSDLINIFKTAETWPNILLMEYLPGKEYSVDVLNIPKNKRMIIPRVRDKIRSGISFITSVVHNYKIESQINSLLENKPLFGVFGFQFKENENGTPCLIECNPRIQGTMVAAQMAGVNIIWAAVESLVYEKLKTPLPKDYKDIKFLRYWGGVAETGDGVEFI